MKSSSWSIFKGGGGGREGGDFGSTNAGNLLSLDFRKSLHSCLYSYCGNLTIMALIWDYEF